MKKITGIILTIFLCFTLVACGSKKSDSTGTKTTKKGGAKKESATFDDVTVTENGLLEWNKITGATYYKISNGYTVDSDKFIEKTSTQLRLRYESSDEDIYYFTRTFTIGAYSSRSESNIVAEIKYQVVVQDGKFYSLEDANKYTLRVHYVDSNKKDLEIKEYNVAVIDKLEIYNDIDGEKFFVSHKRDNYNSWYDATKWNYGDGIEYNNTVLTKDADLYITLTKITSIYVKFSYSPLFSSSETIYYEKTFNSFDETISYDGTGVVPSNFDCWYFSGKKTENLKVYSSIRKLYEDDWFECNKEGKLQIDFTPWDNDSHMI